MEGCEVGKHEYMQGFKACLALGYERIGPARSTEDVGAHEVGLEMAGCTCVMEWCCVSSGARDNSRYIAMAA